MSHTIVKWACQPASELTAQPLVEGGFSKEIRINMPKGSLMRDHHAPYPIIVQVLCGQLDFGVGDEHFIMDELDSISLKASEVHNLKANTDCIIRLGLYKDDSFERVKTVVS